MPGIRISRSLAATLALIGASAALVVASAARAQDGAVAAPALPTLEERLDWLRAKLEIQREALHVAGLALAVVKDDKVVFADGFGLRDLEQNLPATKDSLFAIGSSTKAFTATLIAMLIDDGKMNWDDPVRLHLPEFRLHDAEATEKATIRDLLCHRVGLTRTDLAWGSGQASRAEILEAVGRAELVDPFRAKFNYNNVMFLAAGTAAGRAAGSDWDTLIAQRLLEPLNMNASSTRVSAAQQSPLLAKGYDWDEDKGKFEPKPMRALENIAPAGAINSSALDMAQWVRVQLGRGTIGGKRLVSPERIEETWTSQIDMAPQMGYGLGWMVREWKGRRLIEHGGNIDGFSAQVALLPDENVGFVLLANTTMTPLQQASIGIVFDAMLSESLADTAPVEDFTPYLGKYRFDVMQADMTVVEKNGRLAVDVPGQMVYELEPAGADGKRPFSLTDQIAISFVMGEGGDVIAMKMYQAGMEFELPRAGVELPMEVDMEVVRPLLGVYHSPRLNIDLTVLVQNGRLAVDVPGQMVYELHPPNDEQKWVVRVTDTIAAQFNRSDAGGVESMTVFQNGEAEICPRVAQAAQPELITVEEALALHDHGYGTDRLAALGGVRFTGRVNFAHQGVTGTFEAWTEGLERAASHIDLGKFGWIKGAIDGERGWSDNAFHGFDELTPSELAEARLQHPLIIAADWRACFEKVNVVRQQDLDGKPALVVKLEGGTLVSTAWLDRQTGLVLKEEVTMTVPGVGPITATVSYDDYRDVSGVKLPFRVELNNVLNGSMITEYDRIEAGLRFPSERFVLTRQK